jgi:hypothetical protein
MDSENIASARASMQGGRLHGGRLAALAGYFALWCYGTLRQNVSLVQKSRRTSIERSFFAECPSNPSILIRFYYKYRIKELFVFTVELLL